MLLLPQGAVVVVVAAAFAGRGGRHDGLVVCGMWDVVVAAVIKGGRRGVVQQPLAARRAARLLWGWLEMGIVGLMSARMPSVCWSIDRLGVIGNWQLIRMSKMSERGGTR